MPKPVKKKKNVPSRPSGDGWVRNGRVLHNDEICEWWVNHRGGKFREQFVPVAGIDNDGGSRRSRKEI